MFFPSAILGSLLLAGQSIATANAILQRGHDLENMLRRDADLVATLTRRQDANPADTAPQVSTTPASGDAAKADLAKWQEETKAACDNAIRALNGQTSNPTGLAVCYNLPFLDNQTGVFQAELRLYNVTAPINPWNGVQPSDINMALSYLGATVQNMNGSFAKRDEISLPHLQRRASEGVLVERQSPNEPQTLKVLMYVGRLNSNLMGTAMTQATLQPLLIPQIELSAVTPSGQEVTAALSSREASFVNGVFAQASTTENDAAAQASASAAALEAAPFVLPGTNLAFFPIGLVITSVWTAGFFLAVGLGTIGRIQFRDQYRRRMRREAATAMRTI